MLVDGSRFYRPMAAGADEVVLTALDFTAPDATSGPAYIINADGDGFDVDDGVAAAASDPTWTNRALYGWMSWAVDVSGMSGEFLLLLELDNSSSLDDDGLVILGGFGDHEDPTSATVGGLFGIEDVASTAQIRARATGDLWASLNALETEGDCPDMVGVLHFNAAHTEVLGSSAYFHADGAGSTRSSSGSGAALDASGGTVHVYVGAGYRSGTPSADIPVLLTAQYRLIDLSGS